MEEKETRDIQKSLDEKYMKQAVKQAKKAEANKDVPIGCVIVHDGKVIARGYNRRNMDKTTLAHAEILAIKKASKVSTIRFRISESLSVLTIPSTIFATL